MSGGGGVRDRLAASLACTGLTGAGGVPVRPLEEPAWRGLLAAARSERIQGVLAHAVASGSWPSTSAQLEEARTAHREAMASVLLIDRRLRELAPALDAAGVRWRVLKGPATAHLDEVDPSWRVYGDLDLLVHGDDVGAVLHLLAAMGGTRRYARRSGEFDRRFGKGAAVVLPDGVELDVHRTIALGPFGLALDPATLLAGPTDRFCVGDAAVAAPDRAGRFLHACYHTALGQELPRLSSLRDVARTFPTDEDEARRVHRMARAARGEAVLASAITTTMSTIGWAPTGPLATWAAALRPNARDRRWLGAYRGPRSSSRARTLLAVEALPDLRSRFDYARAVAIDELTDVLDALADRRDGRATPLDAGAAEVP